VEKKLKEKKLEEILDDVADYMQKIVETGHYGDKIQVVDLLKFTGDLEGFCKGNAIKYIARYGKKTKSTDLTDLYKAIHYIILMIMENEHADK
jgi:hypothetical protein